MATSGLTRPLALIVGVGCLVVPVSKAVGVEVTGIVREAAGPQPPIADARMTLFDPALTSFWEVRTDGQGQYSFTGIPAGTYQLGASAPALAYIENAVVVAGGPLVADVLLPAETETGSWDVIGNTLPEFLDGTDIGILRPDGKIFYCHDTMEPLVFDPLTGGKFSPAGSPRSCSFRTTVRR